MKWLINIFFKTFTAILPVFIISSLFSSCSDDDYVNAIPSNSIALVSLDLRKMAAEGTGNEVNNAKLLNSLLHVENAGNCGIDLQEKIYLFESAEGNLGLVAKVKDNSDVEEWLEKLVNGGICKNRTKRSDYQFAIMKDSWVIGFSDETFMMMGPVIVSQYAEVQQAMIKYMSQDEEQGIKPAPLYEKLDSMEYPLAIVAKASALPQQMVVPFMIGAPKNAEPSQIMIAAGMTTGTDGLMQINGEIYSLNEKINKELKEAYKNYRPISGGFIGNIESSSLFAAFMNVEGEKYLPMLRANSSAQVLLAGINTAIDMDNIIRSIDGDLFLASPGFEGSSMQMQMGARLKKKDFMADVDYWKQSCPAGSKITNWEKGSFCYNSGDFNLFFGVSDNNVFYSGTTTALAKGALTSASAPLPENIRNAIAGKRLCIMVNVEKLIGDNEEVRTALNLLVPLTGKVNTILYTID